MTWQHHIKDSLSHRLSKAQYAIVALSHTIFREVFHKIYFTYFYSITFYGIIFWVNPQIQSECLRLKNGSLNLLQGLYPDSRVYNFLKNCKFSLFFRWSFSKVCYLLKSYSETFLVGTPSKSTFT